MKRSVIAILVFGALVISCNKDNIPAPQGSRLSRIMAGGNVNSEYFYNDQGNLIKYTYSHNEEVRSYNDEGKVIKIERAMNVSSSFTPKYDYGYSEIIYNANGRLSELKNYHKINSAYNFVSKTVPDYDAKGRVISNTIFTPDNKPAKKTVYQYNSRGNIVLQELYQYESSPVLTHKSTYEFDNKNNPYVNIGVMPLSVNRNNYTKIVETNYIITPGKPVITTNLIVYKRYNALGYPELVNENGWEYEYEYQ